MFSTGKWLKCLGEAVFFSALLSKKDLNTRKTSHSWYKGLLVFSHQMGERNLRVWLPSLKAGSAFLRSFIGHLQNPTIPTTIAVAISDNLSYNAFILIYLVERVPRSSLQVFVRCCPRLWLPSLSIKWLQVAVSAIRNHISILNKWVPRRPTRYTNVNISERYSCSKYKHWIWALGT